ncbi:MAG TPA: hypothetical protein VJ725_33895 [Thermoanaerobaculia bacterium]|nr:hypothetical protein [Thermoanaerobaculia bacterium]
MRELPREHARTGFTARVIRNLDAPETGRPVVRWRPVAALTAALLVAVALSAGLLQARKAESVRAAEARQLLEEIRAEHGRLAREVEEMSEPPVIYLGGTEDVDFVVDLSQVPETEGGVRPAAYQNQTF